MKHRFLSAVTFFLKNFSRHQSFQQIEETMLCVDVFDRIFTNGEQNEHTLLSFSNLQLIFYVLSLLIPVISFNIRTLKARSSSKHF
jgi:hypothetical protein